jgi:DNA polymerase III subunit delta'
VPLLPLYGHEALRQRLLAALARGALGQSLLLQGSAGVGKQRVALWLAQVLVCERPDPPCGECRHCRYALALTHPDILWCFPRPRLKDGDATAEEVRADLAAGTAERLAASGLYAPPSGTEALYVSTIRALVQMASVTPALARRKVFVIGDADRMVPQEGADQAANAFLKLLEEPPSDTWIILTTSAPGALLPTIRSRVVAARVAPLPDREMREWLGDPAVRERIGVAEGEKEIAHRLRLAAGAPGRLLAAAHGREATGTAERLLEAAVSGDRERALRLALAQGGSGARGAFSDILDALTAVLAQRMRQASESGDDATAARAARAQDAVEESKTIAAGNVSPQLITDFLLRGMTAAFRS